MPIAGQVIDFYDDASFECLKSRREDFAKFGSANILSPEEIAGLPDEDFALVVLTKQANLVRKFPLVDDAHVKLAAVYFDENNAQLSVQERVTAATHIREACDAHEIECPDSVAKYAADGAFSNVVSEGQLSPWDEYVKEAAAQELTKTASSDINARLEMPDSNFALVLEHDGEIVRKYAMPDESHVKIASAYFKKYAGDLSPEHRHSFAASVLSRADELGVDLDSVDHLTKWASPSYGNLVNFHLEERRALLPRDEEHKAVLDKLASFQRTAEPSVFAEALHAFDKKAGLDKYYDRGVTEPWESVMGHQKNAGWSSDVDGDTLTEDDLRRAATSDKLRSHFGETFSGQFSKHAVNVFDSLPDPDKIVIKQIAKGEI